MRRILVLLSVLLAATAVVSCGKGGKEPADVGARGKVLATVNGVPIYENDLMQAARGQDPGGDPLRSLVRQELIHQKALKLGLDNDKEYRRRVGQAEAQLQMFRKQELSRILNDHIVRQAVVTDAEIREFFEKNADFIRTQYHVQMIFYRGDESRLADDYRALQGGTPFEEVASRRFPGIPKGSKAPWDLGFLAWDRVPEEWREILPGLEPGKVSPILSLPGGHRGIIRVVAKKVDPVLSLSSEREKIVNRMRKRKIEELQEKMVAEMEKESEIVYKK
ncbi:MAG: peptidyl-prolyl cis-trans isomerase [Thermodesulfobacteriota bacterium]